MTEVSDKLASVIEYSLVSVERRVIDEFVSLFQEQYPGSLRAVLLYGSCLREHDYQDSLIDFYVVVSDYQLAHSSTIGAWANRLLPPNVYFAQQTIEGYSYRAKYAVVAESHFLKLTSSSTFHSYFWARFVQPVALVFHRDHAAKQNMIQALCNSAHTFLGRTVKSLNGKFSSQLIWEKGFSLTYRSEIRAEKAARAGQIYDRSQVFYDRVAEVVLEDNGAEKQGTYVFSNHLIQSTMSSVLWGIRIAQGKFLSVMRLAKATYTFVGGVDYILWKIERHSGQKIEATERLRKYPLIFSWPLLWKLYRSKAIR